MSSDKKRKLHRRQRNAKPKCSFCGKAQWYRGSLSNDIGRGNVGYKILKQRLAEREGREEAA